MEHLLVSGWCREFKAKLIDSSLYIPQSIIELLLYFIGRDFIAALWAFGMRHEIVNIQVGHCGNQISNVFWKLLCKEHKTNTTTGQFEGDLTFDSIRDVALLDKIDVYFEETEKQKYIPRSCIIDLEPATNDMIKASEMKNLFKSTDNQCFGASGCGNNWAKGHYSEGAEIIDDVMDIIRKKVESTNCLQGFQIVHSLGGGTGSGLGTLIMLKLKDDYPPKKISTFSVYPSPKVSDCEVEPYNALLSIHQMSENADATHVIDNEALYSIVQRLGRKEPKISDMNDVISQAMSGVTASLRYECKLNGDLRRMIGNLVPFPRLHFLLMSTAPIISGRNNIRMTVQELTDEAWSSSNFLSKIEEWDAKYLSVANIFCGRIATSEYYDETAKMQQKMADDFVSWIPNIYQCAMIGWREKMTVEMIANTTAIKGVFQRIQSQFSKLYKRNAFMHWYKGEGMDSMEFQEAYCNVRDLITEYEDKQYAVVDLSDDESYDESEEDDEEEESDDGDEEEDEDF